MEVNDWDLLRQYSQASSQDAFTALVRRHVDLVHSTALRQVRLPQLAEEVAQSVFTDLARHAGKLKPGTILTAWLYQVTRRAAIDVVRSESHRQARERFAAEMATMNSSPDWTHIEPLLDEGMDALDETDRAAVLLRYFENKSLREVGEALGTSEDAAQKRVSRAVERLREFFVKHGLTVGASGLAAAISANAVQAAPVGLATTLSAIATNAALSIPASGGAGAIPRFLRAHLPGARSKLATGLATTAIVGVAMFTAVHFQQRAARVATPSTRQIAVANLQPTQQPATTDSNAKDSDEQREPDPLALLRGVAEARQRIGSGSLVLQLYSETVVRGRKRSNQPRLTVTFDGPKLRFESLKRDYAYTFLGNDDDPEAAKLARQAESIDREEAVKAGLLRGFEAHVITACDGVTLARYREDDRKQGSTTIEDPIKGAEGSEYFFDPRCLGLAPSLSYGSTIENCLGYNSAKSVRLIGKESVDGIPAWHVQLQSQGGDMRDFWVDDAHRGRLLECASGDNYVVSRYDDANPRDPIPIELTTVNPPHSGYSNKTKWVRSNAQFNVPIEPATFTLAGLDMPVGTPVTDSRNYRSLGYWTGAGFSEFPPSERPEPQPFSPTLAEQLALVENYPASAGALDAAIWILLNTPDGPEVEKAAEAILQYHIRDTNLVHLCGELERVRHRCSKPLLVAMLKDNPSADVRGTACFHLALILKDDANYGRDKKATAEAIKYFDRVIADYPRVKLRGFDLAKLAMPELHELRDLAIGKPAPEIEGHDLRGRPMRLSNYRGKVTVLVFGGSVYPEAWEHRMLLEQMEGKPFALVGVIEADDPAQGNAYIEQNGITWPSFWDKRSGPIITDWNVRSWPNIWVLDRQGVIRYRHVRGSELRQAVEALLRE